MPEQARATPAGDVPWQEANDALEGEKHRLDLRYLQSGKEDVLQFAKATYRTKIDDFQSSCRKALAARERKPGPEEQRAIARGTRDLQEFLANRVRREEDLRPQMEAFLSVVDGLIRRVDDRTMLVDGTLADADRKRSDALWSEYERDQNAFMERMKTLPADHPDVLLFARAALDRPGKRDPLFERAVLSRIVTLPAGGRILSEAIESPKQAYATLDLLRLYWEQPWAPSVLSAISWQVEPDDAVAPLKGLPQGKQWERLVDAFNARQTMKVQLPALLAAPNPQPRAQLLRDRGLRHLVEVQEKWRDVSHYLDLSDQPPPGATRERWTLERQAMVSRYLSHRRLPVTRANMALALEDARRTLEKYRDTYLFDGGDVLYLAHNERDDKGRALFGTDPTIEAVQQQLNATDGTQKVRRFRAEQEPRSVLGTKKRFLDAVAAAGPRDTVLIDTHGWYRDADGRVHVKLAEHTEAMQKEGIAPADVTITPREFAQAVRQRAYEKGAPLRFVFSLCVSAEFMDEFFAEMRGSGKSLLCVSEAEYGQYSHYYGKGGRLNRPFFEHVLRLDGGTPSTVGQIHDRQFSKDSMNNTMVWFLDEDGAPTQIARREGGLREPNAPSAA